VNDAVEGPHTLIVVDIDHFKSINDQYGHDVGDKALKHFSRILRRNCRHDDIIARFGGEEFIILINQADLNAGLTAARRLCRVLPEAPLKIPGGVLTLTASFGVAELRRSADVDKVIKRADMAVYRAKQEGRNRVQAYDPVMDMHTPE
jgi:diguanylate cyclase (GGDEF)-like protein